MSILVEPTAHNTYGALVIGASFAIFLFGLVTAQTYHYYLAFPNDRPTLQSLVMATWLLELGHTASITYEIYSITISRERIVTVFPGLGVALILGGLVTMLVQCFFAQRLFKLLPKPFNYIGLLCILLTVLRSTGSTFLGVQAITAVSLTDFRLKWSWLITVLLSLGAGLDVVIAGSMLSFLLVRRDEAMGRFAQLIDRLVAYTIRTGVFTSLTAVIVLILFQTMTSNFIWIATYACLAKLYSNSLLAALMERRQLRNELYQTPEQSKSTLPMHSTLPSTPGNGSSRVPSGHRASLFSRRSRNQDRSISVEASRNRAVSIELVPSFQRPDTMDLESGYSSGSRNYERSVREPESQYGGSWTDVLSSPNTPQSPSRVYYGT